MIDVNEYLIERHLREQEAREHHNEFLEEKDCGYCCSYCNEWSESFDEINSHVHGFDGGDEP